MFILAFFFSSVCSQVSLLPVHFISHTIRKPNFASDIDQCLSPEWYHHMCGKKKLLGVNGISNLFLC
uniref:Putative secreted protein n=1 Tax=Amblyomma triste TaxID=251400 RepID=A0A023G0L6_AMBTT